MTQCVKKISPLRVKISYKFLPFVNTRNQDFVAPVSQHRTTEAITVPSVNNVAERYLNHPSTVPDKNHIPTNHYEEKKSPPTIKQNKHYALAEALQIVSGSVTESTLLQAQSICKVKVSLKGISDHVTATALSESSRVRGINLENGLYHTNRGKLELFVINTLHTDVPIKKGTELGDFQVCKAVEVINTSH